MTLPPGNCVFRLEKARVLPHEGRNEDEWNAIREGRCPWDDAAWRRALEASTQQGGSE